MWSGWWFIVRRQKRWSSASVTVFAGQCLYVAPSSKSSRYRPYGRAPVASRDSWSNSVTCFVSVSGTQHLRSSEPSLLDLRPGLVALDHSTDQLDDFVLTDNAHIAVLVGVAPVLKPPVLRELVEVRARREHGHLRVRGGIALDIDLREHNPPRLRVLA